MSSTTLLLQYAAGGGALYCALAYIYGCIFKPKGDRRIHVASLMFSGLALAALAAALPSAVTETNLFAFICAIMCLNVSVAGQAYSAFRGRSSDRRSDRRATDQRPNTVAPAPIKAEAPLKAA